MKFVKRIDSVFEIFSINKKVFLVDNEKKEIINSSENNHLPISYVKHTKNYFYDILVGQILIYDDSFRLASKIIDPENTQFNSSIEENDNGWILLLSKRNGERKLMSEFKIISNEKILHQNWYCGKILSNNFLLHYKYEERFNPSYLRCSDLLDTTTHWEYECSEGFQTKNKWIIRGEYLLFCINKQDYFAGKFIKINVKTGVVKWLVDVSYTDMLYDETQGIFVSFWAGNNNGNNYQIIDIDNETVDIGVPHTEFELSNVSSLVQMQYLRGTKLFFADNIQLYGDNTMPVKFGCFDIVSKKVNFLQEIPVEHGIQISQLFYNENNLYIRMTLNTLLVYEDD